MNWYKIIFCFDSDGGDGMVIKKCKKSVLKTRLKSPSNFVKISNIKYRKKRAVSYFFNWKNEPLDYIKVWIMAFNKKEAIALLLRNLFQVAIRMNSLKKEHYREYMI